MSLPHLREMLHQFIPPLPQGSMSGQGATQRCLCHLCQGRSCSFELKSFPAPKLLPMTNSNERSCLWQASVLLSKTSFAEKFFSCSCLLSAQPCSPLALQREIWVGKEFPPLFHLQPWPAGTLMDSQSCTLLNSHSRCGFFSGVSCKETKKGSLEGVSWVYTGVLCCLRANS